MLKSQYINFYRGVAILLVFFLHTTQNFDPILFNNEIKLFFNFGQFGVQLFFIISSITLCSSITNRKEDTFLYFYIRRFFRIVPIYYISIFIYLGFYYFTMNRNDFDNLYNYNSIIKTVFFINTFDSRYFNHIVPGNWSVSDEMLFYLILPFLYFIQHKYSNKIFILFSSICVFFCYFCINKLFLINEQYFYYNDVSSKYLEGFGFFYAIIFTQLSVFLVGIIFTKFNHINKYLSFTLFLSFLLLTIYLMIYSNTTNKFFIENGPFFYLITISISFCSLINFSSHFINKTNNYFIKFISLIGEYSFSVYLFHFIIIDSIDKSFDSLGFYENDDFITYQILFLFIISLFITIFICKYSHRYIENYFISIGNKIINKLKNKTIHHY